MSETTTNTTVTYTKLRSGDWGLRGPATILSEGASVTVTKRSGETKPATVGRVLWSGDGVAIATIASSSTSRQQPRSRSRGTWTGCRCGSVEEYAKRSDCWTCQHDRD